MEQALQVGQEMEVRCFGSTPDQQLRPEDFIRTSWIIKTLKYYCRITISILLNG